MNYPSFNLNALHNAMRSAGVDTDYAPHGAGAIERFHVNGDKSGSKNGWIVAYVNGDFVVACFGTWTQLGVTHKWCSKSTDQLSDDQRKEFQAKVDEAKARQGADLAASRAVAKNVAMALWERADVAMPTHPYLIAKQVTPVGIRQRRGDLVIPVLVDGGISSLQFINKSGQKKFLRGGEVKGGYFLIGNPEGRLLLCEGLATGLSLHEATGHAVAIAFNAGNLTRVAKAIRQKYLHAELVICADNDIHDDWKENVGVINATEAAKAVGGLLSIPELNGMKCDFNDVHKAQGLGVVKACIDAATKVAPMLATTTLRHFVSTSPNYVVTDSGVYFKPPEEDEDTSDDSADRKKRKTPKSMWICGPLHVMAITRSDRQEDFGKLLIWIDVDHKLHRWAMPMELLNADGAQFRAELLRLGLTIEPNQSARNHLSTYIATASPEARARCVSRIGWFNNMYVLPNKTIGQRDELVIFQASEVARHSFAEEGTLDSWRRNVAALCVGNSRLIFAMSCAFAAPLLKLMGDESGGFHLRGTSSNGKTTTLVAAASVWGGRDFIQSWRATGNGLEGVAVLSNDNLLILDEIAQVDPREVGDIAYLLANGQGKARAGRDGLARRSAKWNLIFLSTGELSLADHMLQSGKRAKAGQETRMADIPADAGKSLGVFENIHQCADGASFSRTIINSVRQNHGTAGPAFIDAIVDKLDILPSQIDAMRREFVQEVLPIGESSHGQVIRVADRFALVAIAGELATNLGITGWQPHEAEKSVKACFEAWLETRENGGDLEAASMLSQVKAFFEAHGESRFTSLDDDQNRTTNHRAGFVREASEGVQYLVLPEVYKTQICSGFNAKTVTKLLMEKKWLVLGADGKPQSRETLPGMGRTRCYVFNAEMWRA